MDSDSLFPILESASEEKDSCRTQGSAAEVFLAGTLPAESSHRGGAPVKQFAIAANATLGDGLRSGPQHTQEAAEQFLNTPVPGDSPVDKALDDARQTALAERAHLVQIKHDLIDCE